MHNNTSTNAIGRLEMFIVNCPVIKSSYYSVELTIEKMAVNVLNLHREP